MSLSALEALQAKIAKPAETFDFTGGIAAPTPAPAPAVAWTPPGVPAPAPATAINPPEFQPPPLTPTQAAPAYTPTPAPQAYTPSVEVAAETPKKRGRPKKDAPTPAPTSVPTEASVPVIEVPVNTPTLVDVMPRIERAPAPAAPATGKPLAFLFVGCRPVTSGIQVTEFETLCAWVNEQIKKDLAVDDYSFVEFGKGAGAVSLYAEKYVQTQMVRGTCLVIDTRTREASLMLSRLLPLAENVIRGV